MAVIHFEDNLKMRALVNTPSSTSTKKFTKERIAPPIEQMLATYLQKLGYASRNQPQREPAQELLFCLIFDGEHATSECPTLRSVYRPQGYQGNRQGYEGQKYKPCFAYPQAPKATAPLALPLAPQQAPIATQAPITTQAMAIVPFQTQRPYVQDQPYQPISPYPPAILPPQPKIAPINQVISEEVVELEYEEVEGEDYQEIYPEYYVHDDEGPKPVYQVNAI